MESAMPQKKADGTYVCVKFTKESGKKLYNFAKSLGLKPIPAHEMHITIVYSTKKLKIKNGISGMNFSVQGSKLEYLGDKDSNWRALTLKLKSEKLQDLHDSFKEYGYIHPYDDFIPHVSLAYQPPEDLELDKIEVPDFELDVQSMVIETLKI